jgi:TonB family protein
LALKDPTLFALPHFRGFSGDAWLKPPPAPERSFEWTEEPRWLALETQGLPGVNLEAKPENLNAFEVVNASAPEPSSLILSAPLQFPQGSTMSIDGALARRELLTSPVLPSWGSTNLLTNTVVRIMVNGEGLPRSATLLIRSGVNEADDYALKTTRNLRFKAQSMANGQKSSGSVLDWGEVVFQWHGVAPTGGNK